MHGFFWSAAMGVGAPDHRLERPRPSAPVTADTARPRRHVRPALLLGMFFLSLYLLTMGGHLDSPDEELMFQVTRSLALRGSMDIGDTVLAEGLAQVGTNGRSYAPYGPVASVMSVPFYDLGQGLAGLLPQRYSEVATRFAVGLRDPLISAAACVLFYAFGLELGFGTFVATLLTLAFGGATLVWPYSKYSFSEPVTGFWLLLAVFGAVRAVRSSRSIAWSALSGIALGLAIGSKVTAVLAVPGVLLYLAAAGSAHPKLRARRVLPFVAILGLPALALGVNNMARFGNPFDTGYHLEGVIDLAHPIGIAGLLVSPSKSLFVYAPVAVLGLVGFVRLGRRLPWEAGLFLWLVASHIVFHGVLVIWAGDAGWGPRYLVPIVPFIILPAGALLARRWGPVRRAYWSAFGILAALGVIVNLGGVLVDQRVSFVYLFDLAGRSLAQMDQRRWDPALSPVLIQWQEVAKRTSNAVQWWSQPVVTFVSGSYGKEAIEPVDAAVVPRSDFFPRWTSGSAVFNLRNRGAPVTMSLEYLDNRPSQLGPALVEILVDGSPLPDTAVTRLHSDVALPDKRFPWFIEATLDQAVVGHDAVTVEIRSQPWQPSRDTPPSTDVRDLGVQVWDLQFAANGQDLAIGEPLFSPMPVTDARPWSNEVENWFYTPPWHVADVWIWYLYLSGLSDWLMLTALVPVVGLVWSGALLARLLRHRL
jgi:hypothetical protein